MCILTASLCWNFFLFFGLGSEKISPFLDAFLFNLKTVLSHAAPFNENKFLLLGFDVSVYCCDFFFLCQHKLTEVHYLFCKLHENKFLLLFSKRDGRIPNQGVVLVCEV